MTGRALIAMALLLPSVLAGCVGEGATPTPFTAADGSEVAWTAARAWVADAELRSVFGIEAPAPLAPPEGEAYDTVMADKDDVIGDGRAPAWLYVFRDPLTGDWYEVVVDRNRTVAYDGVVAAADGAARGYDETGYAIDGWLVDSDRAVAQALASVEGLRHAAVEAEQAFLLLRQTPEFPMWGIGFEESGGHDLGFAFVNAKTGAIIREEDAPATAQGPEAEHGEFEGEFDPLDPTLRHPVRIMHANHPFLIVDGIVRAGPGAQVMARLVNPNGQVAAEQVASGIYRLFVPAPAVGDWTVELEVELGLALDHRGWWCAPGRGSC